MNIFELVQADNIKVIYEQNKIAKPKTKFNIFVNFL